MSSVLLGAENEISDNLPLGIEGAFLDDFDALSDPTVRLMLAGFGITIVLGLIAKSLLGSMDLAIENVLVEFENIMRTKYVSRWVGFEAKLEGLVEPERSQRLFGIMEGLERDEPEFMAKIKRDMAN